jgi:phosphoribosyl-dephospho-CoA transferase
MPDGNGARHGATPRQRHALLTIDPSAWPDVLALHPQAQNPLLLAWAANGWPVISRRPAVDDRAGELPVGVPLPPAAGKLRIALCVPPAAVVAQEDLPRLEDAVSAAPPNWHERIDALLALGHRFALTPACFGSLCWQFRTGLTYLSATSDLDVVWPAPAAAEIPALLAGIAAAESLPGPRLDGEIVFADGRAVNWREFYNALAGGDDAPILVKTADGASLAPRGSLLNAARAA